MIVLVILPRIFSFKFYPSARLAAGKNLRELDQIHCVAVLHTFRVLVMFPQNSNRCFLRIKTKIRHISVLRPRGVPSSALGEGPRDETPDTVTLAAGSGVLLVASSPILDVPIFSYEINAAVRTLVPINLRHPDRFENHLSPGFGANLRCIRNRSRELDVRIRLQEK